MKKKDKMKEKWGKKKVFILEADPYKQQTVVVLNGQFSDAIKLYKKLDTPSSRLNIKEIEESQKKNKEDYADDYVHNNGSAVTFTKLPKGYVMLLSHQDNWIDTVELVAHECLHLTHYILKNAGLMLSSDSEEAFTYLQGNLIKDVLREMY